MSEEGDHQHADKTDHEEGHAKIEVAYAAKGLRTLLVLTGPVSVDKFGQHSTEANHNPKRQPPEGTLPKKEPKSHLGGRGVMT